MPSNRITKRWLAAVWCGVLFAAAPAFLASRAFADFSPVGLPREFKNAPAVQESRYLSAVGSSPFDRIALHRFRAASGSAPDGAAPVMLFLPGTNMNGESAIDDPHHNLTLFLAAHGVDAWALDYRTHFVPPATPPERLAEFKSWTANLFESDLAAAVDFISRQTGRRQLFLSGFSRGAAFAYLYAAAHPEQVRGLVILDGFLGRPDKAPAAVAAVLARLSGHYANDVGGRSLTYEKRKALLELVIKDPGAPAPIAKYKTARENLEHVVYDSAAFGGHGGLANPQDGFSDAVVLAHVMLLYDRYWPAVQDYENPFTPALRAGLGQSKIPVLAFSSTNIAPGWPKIVRESAALTSSRDLTFVELKAWGHLDLLCGTRAEAEVYTPMLEWLRRHLR